MTEQPKKVLTEDQILQRNISGMTNRHLRRRLNRLSVGRGLKLRKTPLSLSDMLWSTVLSAVADNSKLTGGKIEAYLR